MTKTITNLWLDLVALVLMLGLMLTGGILHFVLPPGTGHSHWLFGLGRHDYGVIHAWFAVVLLVILALHVILHWSFVCCVVAKQLGKVRPGRRALLGWGAGAFVVTVLLPIVGLVWAKTRLETSGVPRRTHEGAAVSTLATAIVDTPTADESPTAGSADSEKVAGPSVGHHGTVKKHEETCAKGAAVNGRSTIGEAAAAAGMSVDALASELKLRGSPTADTRLGRLRRQAGLSLHTVRQIVCRGGRS